MEYKQHRHTRNITEAILRYSRKLLYATLGQLFDVSIRLPYRVGIIGYPIYFPRAGLAVWEEGRLRWTAFVEGGTAQRIARGAVLGDAHPG